MLTMLRSFLLFALTALAAAQGQPDPTIVHEFGTPGATGSFRARFHPDGAGLVFLQATDHYKSLAAKRQEKHGPGDWLALAWNGNDHGLRLVQTTPSTAFPADPALARWNVEASGDTVKFTLDGGAGLWLEKVLRHDPKLRGFTLEIALINKTSTATGSLDFTLLGLAPVSAAELSLFGTLAVAIAAGTDGAATTIGAAPGPSQPLALATPLSFAGSTNRFFGTFLFPKDDAARTALGAMNVDFVPAVGDEGLKVSPFSSTRVRHDLRLAVPAVGAETRVALGLYAGPKSYRVFATLPEAVRDQFRPILEYDLNSPCCFSIEMPGGRPMAKLLLWLLGIFHDVIQNWGVAIMMLTILVRGLLAPLNFRMQKSMRAYGKKMAVLKPKLDALKAQFGSDQRGYQQAMIAFQREHKMMPPLGGCLPILLTMPVYIGLFTALRTAYDVRQEPFCAWVDDLSVPDALVHNFLFGFDLNLLPILWIVMMLIQTLRTPLPNDPQQRQTMMIMRFMPLIFGVMLYTYAAALLVYMVTSMVWSMIEFSVTKKILGPIDGDAAAFAPQTM